MVPLPVCGNVYKSIQAPEYRKSEEGPAQFLQLQNWKYAIIIFIIANIQKIYLIWFKCFLEFFNV